MNFYRTFPEEYEKVLFRSIKIGVAPDDTITYYSSNVRRCPNNNRQKRLVVILKNS